VKKTQRRKDSDILQFFSFLNFILFLFTAKETKDFLVFFQLFKRWQNDNKNQTFCKLLNFLFSIISFEPFAVILFNYFIFCHEYTNIFY